MPILVTVPEEYAPNGQTGGTWVGVRPYSPGAARVICRRVAAGESLQQICGPGSGFVLASVMGWLFIVEVADFTGQYVAARSARIELMMDEVVAIADELAMPVPVDEPVRVNGAANGAGEDTDGDADKKPVTAEPETTAPAPPLPEKDRLAIAKLRIDARRWLIDKQLPPMKASGPPTKETGRFVGSEITKPGLPH